MGWEANRYDCPVCKKPKCRWMQNWACQLDIAKPWQFVLVGVAGTVFGLMINLVWLLRGVE